MAEYQPIASRLTLRLRTGADEWGKPKLRSKSIAGIDVAAEASSAEAIENSQPRTQITVAGTVKTRKLFIPCASPTKCHISSRTAIRSYTRRHDT